MAAIIQRIRCEVDLSDRSFRFLDVLSSGQAPKIWRGSKVQIELGFFFGHSDNKVILTDLAGLTSITVGAKPSGNLAADFVLPPTTVVSGNFTTNLTSSDWASNDPAKAHVVISYTADQTNVTPQMLWFLIYGTDNAAQNIFFNATNLQVIETGMTGGIGAVTPARVRPVCPFQLQGPDMLWYTLSLAPGDDGAPTLAIAPVGEGDVANRIRPAVPFQLQFTDGTWHTLSLVMGDAGKLTLSINAISET